MALQERAFLAFFAHQVSDLVFLDLIGSPLIYCVECHLVDALEALFEMLLDAARLL